MNMNEFARNISEKILNIRTEEKKLVDFINSIDLSKEQRILDVGCGYGKNLNLLRSSGFKVIGVDINQEIIDANNKTGIDCINEGQFKQDADLYDVILMSHIIEHFSPSALVKFMDAYLDRLEMGGYLIIATPLITHYFYDDFDHVKPYYPAGINMVFGGKNDQVQYYSRNKIELIDIWFRRGPFTIKYFPGFYVSKDYSRFPVILNYLLALFFKMSFGVLGRTNGWMGLYRKVPALTKK